MHQRDWKMLLIGGNSSAGKTVVAQQLASQFDVALAQVDDFRLVLQRVTTPPQQPVLHSFLTWDDVAYLSPQQICERLIEIGEIMSHALEIVVAHHVATDGPLIIEGDGLVPEVAAQKTFDGFPVETQVRSVFILETDKEHLIANMNRRKRGDFSNLPTAEQHRRAEAFWLYGRWLEIQAEQYKLPVLDSRPWETLAQRVVEAINHERQE